MRPVKLNVFCVLFTSWYRDLFLVCNFPTLLSEAIIDIISYLCVYPWHWNCTTLMHFCIAWGEAEGCTVLLKGGTISMPMGRHVDNDFIPGLKTKTDF
jgi:hypothetical protein